MAYADKITTMRRMALITEENGAIEYEGVDIEGTCVLRKVSYIGETILTINEPQLYTFCQRGELIAVYQDPDDEESWEPRADKTN